jgi:transposase
MSAKPNYLLTGNLVRDMCAKSPRERLLHRVHCIALVFYGLSASEVARIFNDSPRAVAYWVKRFNQEGLKGLQEDSRPGRPTKLSPSQTERLEGFIKRSRAKIKPVNAEMISEYILNEFNVSLTVRQCWRILKRLAK